MSGNSNPSINSLASTPPETPTSISEDATFAIQLLEEFNNCQACHISVLSTNSSVRYVPHSPTPSIQEVTSPPPLYVRIAADGIRHHPLISPSSAETILCIEDNNNLNNTVHAITYGLITTIQ